MSNHDLLLVIDLQNVYTEGQPWACCHIRQAARNIRRLLDAGVCGEVLFTRFVPPAQPEGMWREYNRVNAAVNADAFANAMLPEMAPYLERYPLLDKSVYSSFSIPKVREAAARADRYAARFGVPDEIGHDQKVVGKAHLLDHVLLVFQLRLLLFRALAVALGKAVRAELFEIGQRGVALRHLEFRQVVLAEGDSIRQRSAMRWVLATASG